MFMDVGFDPVKAVSGLGIAPIAPVHPRFIEAMGRTNDMILYGGVVHFNVDWDDDKSLGEMVEQVPSSLSKDYGRPFAEVFKEASYDFYKIDLSSSPQHLSSSIMSRLERSSRLERLMGRFWRKASMKYKF